MVTNKLGALQDFGLPTAVRLTSPDHLGYVALLYSAYRFDKECWRRNVGQEALSDTSPHCGRIETSCIIHLYCYKSFTLVPYLLDAFFINSVTACCSTVNDPQRQALNSRQAKVRQFIG
jgi:hypothetical protein